MFDSRVLGVDPGLSRCGVAVVDGPAVRARVEAADVVRTPADAALGERLRRIHEHLDAAVRAHRPAALAVERVFINAQARTGVGAVQVVGLVHLIGAAHRLPVTEYTPSQVKAAVTGVGDADKDQVAFMVQRLLHLDARPTPADKADAMAVALCHLQQFGRTAALAAAAQTAAAAPTAAPSTAGPSTTGPSTTDPSLAGLPPRLAAAIASAGPGLQAVTPAGRPHPADHPASHPADHPADHPDRTGGRP